MSVLDEMRRLPTPQRIDLRGSIQDSLQIANDFEEAPERGTFQEAPSEMEAPGTGLSPLAKIRYAAPVGENETHRPSWPDKVRVAVSK